MTELQSQRRMLLSGTLLLCKEHFVRVGKVGTPRFPSPGWAVEQVAPGASGRPLEVSLGPILLPQTGKGRVGQGVGRNLCVLKNPADLGPWAVSAVLGAGLDPGPTPRKRPPCLSPIPTQRPAFRGSVSAQEEQGLRAGPKPTISHKPSSGCAPSICPLASLGSKHAFS